MRLFSRLFRRKSKADPVERPAEDYDAVRNAVAMLAFETGGVVFGTVHDDGSIDIRVDAPNGGGDDE